MTITLATARAAWPSVLEALRAEKRMLVAEALSEAEVADAGPGRIALRPATHNPIVPETITGKRSVIEAAATKVFGTPTQVVLYDERQQRASEPPAEAPKRLTVSGAKAERLKALRGKDAALDSAMDALDLELLE